MARFLKLFALILGIAMPASADSYYTLFRSTTTGKSTLNLSGVMNVAASSTTPTVNNITLNGTGGVITGLGVQISTASASQISNNSAVLVSSGSSVFISSTATSGQKIIDIQNNSGTSLFNVQQGGSVSLNTPLATSSGGTGQNFGSVATGSIPTFSATGTMSTLPNIGSGGIIVGNGAGVVASTAAFSGTASEVGVSYTAAPATVTLSTLGQTTTCSSNQALLAATFTGGVASGGTCTTVTTSGGTLSGNNTWTGSNTYTSTPTFNTGISLGDSSEIHPPEEFLYATSADGATQSAGCLGVLTINGSGVVVWTSTTSATSQGIQAYTTASCASGTMCQYAFRGILTVTETGASTLGDCVQTSTTRCQGTQAAASTSITCQGLIMKSTGGAGAATVFY